MGVLARLFGAEHASDEDVLLRRYRHLLGTAPIESIEQAHAEAFAGLPEAERAALYEELSRGSGTGERPLSSEPATLARSASRAERRVPGSIESALRAADARGGYAGIADGSRGGPGGPFAAGQRVPSLEQLRPRSSGDVGDDAPELAIELVANALVGRRPHRHGLPAADHDRAAGLDHEPSADVAVELDGLVHDQVAVVAGDLARHGESLDRRGPMGATAT